mmetsp:Transcript_69785/g.113276  ORF Transcript_69785/g.113276 Transcript_69785/m.113276 type:complete len:223 (+) Transcript_69785:476-1144(+)
MCRSLLFGILLVLLEQWLHTLGRRVSEDGKHEGTRVENDVEWLWRGADSQLHIVRDHLLRFDSYLVHCLPNQLCASSHVLPHLMQILHEGPVAHLALGGDLVHTIRLGIGEGGHRRVSWREDGGIRCRRQLVRGVLGRQAHLLVIEISEIVENHPLAEEGVTHDHGLISRLHTLSVGHSVSVLLPVNVLDLVEERVALSLGLLLGKNTEGGCGEVARDVRVG